MGNIKSAKEVKNIILDLKQKYGELIQQETLLSILELSSGTYNIYYGKKNYIRSVVCAGNNYYRILV